MGPFCGRLDYVGYVGLFKNIGVTSHSLTIAQSVHVEQNRNLHMYILLLITQEMYSAQLMQRGRWQYQTQSCARTLREGRGIQRPLNAMCSILDELSPRRSILSIWYLRPMNHHHTP